MITVATYWWNGRYNWGDWLTPYLLQHYSDLNTRWVSPEVAGLISVGSIVGHVDPEWRGAILGAGKLRESDQVPRRAHIFALRGPLTAQGIPGDYALGDPGLIADELVPLPVRTHRLGILPHWSDEVLVNRPEFLKYDPLIISPLWDAPDVVTAIGSCDKIVTSSLHGLILADAFGIPRRFEPTPRLAQEGGFLKHLDYSASIDHPFEPGVTSTPNRFKINDVRSQLVDAFEAYGDYVRAV